MKALARLTSRLPMTIEGDKPGMDMFNLCLVMAVPGGALFAAVAALMGFSPIFWGALGFVLLFAGARKGVMDAYARKAGAR